MNFIPQILFLLSFLAAVYLFAKKIGSIKRNIFLGVSENLSDHPEKRWKNVFLLALGQKKMFKNLTVAVLHLVIYLGFVIINIEVLEIMIDGIVGTHRIFYGFIPSLYPILINAFELLALGVIIVCIIFLYRRNIIHLWRFKNADLKGWPSKDANFILVKVDRASMAVSLETRVPFLDHRVIEFAWSLPLNYKLSNGNGKMILKELLYRYVPKKIMDRPKMGFGIPLSQWLNGPLKGWCLDLLNDDTLKQHNVLNAKAVSKLVKEHLDGKADNGYMLWNFLMLQSWLNENK